MQTLSKSKLYQFGDTKFILFPGPTEWILSRGGPNTMNGAGQTEIPEFTL